jgi:flagellar assembly factor FliW
MTLSAVATLPLLSMTEALPGFPGHRDYVLVTADGDGRLFWLQSMAPEGPRFLAIDPARYFPDYAPALPPAGARTWCSTTPPRRGCTAS